MAEPISAIQVPRQEEQPSALGPVPVRPLTSEPSRAEQLKNVSTRAYAAGEQAYRRTRASLNDLLFEVRRNARQFANEKPLKFVLAIAVVSFVGGVALRIWRSRHE
jgi:hypothetical protein